MEFSAEYVKRLFGLIKFKKFKLRKIDISSLTMKKPSRAVVIIVAILLELILLFVILWIFDERTVFDNDFLEKKSYGNTLKWGWVHKGVAITLVLGAIAWFFTLIAELLTYKDNERPFYKLYK